jgi:N-acetyl-beta-hexosaminidase
MARLILAMVICTSLIGCGIAAKVNARNDMEQSRDAYKACLAQNANNIHACDAAAAAYNADLRAYEATSAGIHNGPTVYNVNPTQP